jgi:hypothetical protein
MPLPFRYERHFNPKIVSAWWIVAFFIAWVSLSYMLYSWALVLVTTFQMMFASMGAKVPLSFTIEERSFYNFFYACMSTALMLPYVARSYFLHLIGQKRKTRLGRHAILGEQAGLSHVTLFIFTKQTLVYGGIASVFPVYLDFTFHEYRFWLLAIPLLISVQIWNNFSRLAGRTGLEVMATSFVSVVVISFLFSNFPVVDTFRMDEVFATHSPDYHYKLGIPAVRSEALQKEHGRDVLKLFLGYPKGDSTAGAKIFLNHFPFSSLSSNELKKSLEKERLAYNSFEVDNLVPELFIDRNVPMKTFRAVKRTLAELEFFRLNIAMGEDHKSAVQRNFVFTQFIPACDLYFESLTNGTLLDSNIFVSPWCSGRFEFKYRLYLTLKSDTILVNGEVKGFDQLYHIFQQFIQSHPKESAIMFYCDDDVSFEKYLDVYNEELKVRADLYDAEVQGKFKFSYRESFNFRYDEQYNEMQVFLREKYDLDFIDLTSVEKDYLIKVLKQPSRYF